ncbi:MAG: hypothetical protein ACYTFW_18930 [Planctomycetota bacterium]|jgi:hypothetical protein
MPSNYTANAYGANDSRKGGDKTTTALRNPESNVSKGQTSMRFVVAAGSEITGGVIFVNKGTTIAALDTFTITVQAG